MSNQETIALLGLIWTIISSIAAAAWVVVPVFLKWVKPRWEEWRCRRLVPSQRGATDLVNLIKLFGKIQGRLSSPQNEIVAKIQRDLGQFEWRVWTEALPYATVYTV